MIQTANIPQAAEFCAMDKGYEGESMRAAVVALGLTPVVPPKSNRRVKWDYDKNIYKKRNEVERFFLRIKRYRRIATRYDKLDFMFLGYLIFAMIIESLRNY